MIILSAPMTSRCPKQPVRGCKTPSDSLLSPLQSTNAVYRFQSMQQYTQQQYEAHTTQQKQWPE